MQTWDLEMNLYEHSRGHGEVSYGPIQSMFNGSGEVGVEEADCAASVGRAVKWDGGGSQPAQDGWSGL